MRTLHSLAFFAWFVSLSGRLAAQDAAEAPHVHYVVDATAARTGLARVEMTIENNSLDELRVAIPAWAPGSYRIVPYHERLRNLRAFADGRALEAKAVDDKTWSIRAGRAPAVKIEYTLAPKKGDLSAEHYYVEGPATFLYVVGRTTLACTVRFLLPSGWKVASGLADLGDGIYGHRDYDSFIDCPTELGAFETISFRQGGVTYEVVSHSEGAWDSPRLVEAIKKIVREQTALFGGVPFDRYVFLYHFQSQFSGYGLEHLNSTHIAMPYFAMKQNGLAAASITSHEFFHLWNVKRIRPQVLGPFDYSGPVRTKALWFCEGVTSYYGDLTLARSGVWSRDTYLRHLAQTIESIQNNPLRRTVSAEQSSWTVWDRKPTDPYLDYYAKGELLGWLLDLQIRAATKGKRSLDDVLRHLHKTYVVEGARKTGSPIGLGYPEDGILKAVNDVSGGDFSAFFGKYVAGTEELPYAETLRTVGLSAQFEVSATPGLSSNLMGTRVLYVPPGSGDERAGLQAGDVIVQVGEARATSRSLRQELGKRKAGDTLPVEIQRGESRQALELTVVSQERSRVHLQAAADATAEQRAAFERWLASSAGF